MGEGSSSPFTIPRISLGMKPYIFFSVIAVIIYTLWEDTGVPEAPSEYVEAPAIQQSATLETLVTRCAECHGQLGEQSNGLEPYLAGQNIDYLVFAMRTYSMGLRKHAAMEEAILGVTIKDIKKLADYYASQEGEWIGRGLGMDAWGDEDYDPATAGAKLATENCQGCHHQGKAGVPNLNGLSFEYLVDSLVAYQNRNREHAEMNQVVKELTIYDVEKLSFYYAGQPPIAPAAETNAAANSTTVEACNECHGRDGISLKKRMPTLAAQDRDYFINAIQAYKTGGREHKDMQSAVASLSDGEIAKLADHYAAITNVPKRVREFKHPKKLSKVCNTCHGYNGHSQNSSRPMISGQVEAYLVQALLAYQAGVRDNSAMFKVTIPLSRLEILAIADFYAQQN